MSNPEIWICYFVKIWPRFWNSNFATCDFLCKASSEQRTERLSRTSSPIIIMNGSSNYSQLFLDIISQFIHNYFFNIICIFAIKNFVCGLNKRMIEYLYLHFLQVLFLSSNPKQKNSFLWTLIKFWISLPFLFDLI